MKHKIIKRITRYIKIAEQSSVVNIVNFMQNEKEVGKSGERLKIKFNDYLTLLNYKLNY